MEGKGSTRSPGCARRNSRRILSPDACFCSGAGGERRSASWSRTAKGSGWHRSGCRKGGLYRSEEHTSELQSHSELVCRLLLEKKNTSSHMSHTQRYFPTGIVCCSD